MQKGEILSELQFYTVKEVSSTNIILTTDNNQDITVTAKYADAMLNSADDHATTEKITRTELVSKFLSSTRVAMTVNFNKKIKEAEVKKEIVNLYPNKGGKIISQADFKKEVGRMLDLKGEERTMIGRHYGSQDENGRVSFIDMNAERDTSKDYDTRFRLVDPRTLNYLIVENVKYEVK